MPCYTRTVVKVMTTNADLKLFKKALEKLGYDNIRETEEGLAWSGQYYGGRYESKTGKLTVKYDEDAQPIMEGYAAEIVREQMDLAGWEEETEMAPVAQKKLEVEEC